MGGVGGGGFAGVAAGDVSLVVEMVGAGNAAGEFAADAAAL